MGLEGLFGVAGLVLALRDTTQFELADEAVRGVALFPEQNPSPVLRVDPNVWSGALDVTTIDDTPGAPVIRVTAEHAMLAWQQPSGELFSHQQQLAIDATDLFFEYAASMAEATLVWPDKSFFKQ